LRKLFVLGFLLAVLGALDQGARVFAEDKLQERAQAEVRGAANVTASISSFPFLGRLLVSNSISDVEVRAERAALGDLLTATVEVDLRGVRLQRDALLSGRVKLEDIDAGTVTVELDADGLGQVLKVPVSIAGGQVSVTVAGRSVTGRATVDGGALVLEVAGLGALRVPIARSELITCAVAGVEVVGGTIRLSCEIDEVPPVLLR